jgi:hypothetical protein
MRRSPRLLNPIANTRLNSEKATRVHGFRWHVTDPAGFSPLYSLLWSKPQACSMPWRGRAPESETRPPLVRVVIMGLTRKGKTRGVPSRPRETSENA